MPQMQSTVAVYGDGSTAAKPKPFVFLVTDGMQNGQHFFTWNGKYTYPGNPSKFSGTMRVMGRLAAVADRPEHVRGAQERRGDDLGPLHPVQPDLVREQQWRYRLGEQPGQRLQPDLSNAPEILCIAGFLSNSKYTYGHQ